MEILKLISGYVLVVSGMLLIRTQGLNYSNKKAVGLLLAAAGAILLFFVVWWHILIAFFLSAIIAVISGKKSGIEKEVEKDLENKTK